MESHARIHFSAVSFRANKVFFLGLGFLPATAIGRSDLRVIPRAQHVKLDQHTRAAGIYIIYYSTLHSAGLIRRMQVVMPLDLHTSSPRSQRVILVLFSSVPRTANQHDFPLFLVPPLLPHPHRSDLIKRWSYLFPVYSPVGCLSFDPAGSLMNLCVLRRREPFRAVTAYPSLSLRTFPTPLNCP